jgi:glutamine amidotransferase
MIVIVDYGLGNLASLENWFNRGGLKVLVSKEPEDIVRAKMLILPGVGSFGYAMEKLSPFRNLLENHVKNNKPLIGICLGMQLLFEKSYEEGVFQGLGFIKGEILPIPAGSLKIPHMGWHRLKSKNDQCIYHNKHVYFVHSYYLKTKEEVVVSSCNYGVEVPGVILKDRIMGFQFHPEKSGTFGETILENIKEFYDECISSN